MIIEVYSILGLFLMIWSMFISKKLSCAAFLIEKVILEQINYSVYLNRVINLFATNTFNKLLYIVCL